MTGRNKLQLPIRRLRMCVLSCSRPYKGGQHALPSTLVTSCLDKACNLQCSDLHVQTCNHEKNAQTPCCFPSGQQPQSVDFLLLELALERGFGSRYEEAEMNKTSAMFELTQERNKVHPRGVDHESHQGVLQELTITRTRLKQQV